VDTLKKQSDKRTCITSRTKGHPGPYGMLSNSTEDPDQPEGSHSGWSLPKEVEEDQEPTEPAHPGARNETVVPSGEKQGEITLRVFIETETQDAGQHSPNQRK